MRKRRGLFLIAIVLSAAVAAAEEPGFPPAATKNAYGGIAGRVRDSRGAAQAGIPVTVARQDGRFTQKIYTQSDGRFNLSRLLPGLYAVEVILPSFLPVWKGPLAVRPGAQILLEINLWTLAESMELRLPENPAQAREEWKRVLRTPTPSRPILRFYEEGERASGGAVQDPRERALRGTVQFWAGNDAQRFGGYPRLHTSFEMEYEWTGRSTVDVAGSAGWERGTPAASFRTAWNRRAADDATSSLFATVRQLFLPAEYWQEVGFPGGPRDGRVQSITVGYENEMALGARVRLHYGSLFDTLTLGERMNRWSPFGRLTYLHTENTRVSFAYTAAAPRVLPSDGDPAPQRMEQWLAVPQLSTNSSIQPVLEGGRHVEAAVEHQWDSRYRLQGAAYYDSLSNEALSLANVQPRGFWSGLLRDPFSNRYFLSGEDYSSPGARAALAARLSENSEVVVGYSYGAGLRALSRELEAESPEALRSLIRAQRGHSFSVKVSSTVPLIHTHIITSYRWIPRNSVASPDPYDRGLSRADPYLNVVLLQPLPSPDILRGQFQALADFNNLLAQGYLTVRALDGSGSLLFPAARSFRGGFNFIF